VGKWAKRPSTCEYHQDMSWEYTIGGKKIHVCTVLPNIIDTCIDKDSNIHGCSYAKLVN
jgi:hypothetical protein